MTLDDKENVDQENADNENTGKKIPRRTMLRAAAVSAAAALMGASGIQRAPGAGQSAGSGPGNNAGPGSIRGTANNSGAANRFGIDNGLAANGNDTTQLYADPTKTTGTLPGKLGTRSPYEQPVKKPSDISSRTPLQDLYGIITPSDLHFERSHAGVPRIDPEKYELLIHGMVERPMVFSLRDLKRFPAVSRIAFIECSGNFRSGKETMTAQEICGLTSQSEWIGVMLSTLFREVGVHPKATWFLAEGSDAAVMTRSIPVEKGWKDAMIAYGQNGEAIRPEQGYPARLFLPGWEGNTNVKWIRRIELSDQPFMTREETSKYTETIRDHKIRQFSFDMDARSIITYPSFPQQVEKGWIEIRGIAWSGRGKIDRVEVSTDAGKHWQKAVLQEPVLDKAHTYFRHLWYWDGKPTEIMSLAVDDTGYRQPTMKQLIQARGTDMGGYHVNPVTAWQLKGDGTVLFKPEKWK